MTKAMSLVSCCGVEGGALEVCVQWMHLCIADAGPSTEDPPITCSTAVLNCQRRLLWMMMMMMMSVESVESQVCFEGLRCILTVQMGQKWRPLRAARDCATTALQPVVRRTHQMY